MPMLPYQMNNVLSLVQGAPRLTITLSIDINSTGIVDFSTASYDMTILENIKKLSYTSADNLIFDQEEISTLDDRDELRFKLQSLYKVALKRREFREQFESFTMDEGRSEGSQIIVEELMLITSNMLNYFKNNVLNTADDLYDQIRAFKAVKAI